MGELIKPSPAETQEPKPLTPSYAALLFFHSFRHSQGSPVLQKDIFHYLKYANSHWTLPPGEEAQMQIIAKRRMEQYLFGRNGKPKQKYIHIEPTPTYFYQQVLEMSEEMRKVFNGPQNYLKDELMPSIIEMMVERDVKFLLGGGLRNAGKQNVRKRFAHDANNPLLDKNFSFICYYGLNGKPTGAAEFDEMYSDIRNYLKTEGTSSLSRETDAGLDAVIHFYNGTHPNDPVNF